MNSSYGSRTKSEASLRMTFSCTVGFGLLVRQSTTFEDVMWKIISSLFSSELMNMQCHKPEKKSDK